MIIVMKQTANGEQLSAVERQLTRMGLGCHPIPAGFRIAVGVIGDGQSVSIDSIERLPGVDRAVRITTPYKLVSRELLSNPTRVPIGPVVIGDNPVHVIAGPCAVEDRETLLATARGVREAGGTLLRGGAFKPRTSPYSFQGLGRPGLDLLTEARIATGLPIVTEVVSPADVSLVGEHADMLQVGARNMQNFSLLWELGRQPRPVLLKRGAMATIEEWLLAAEYLVAGGNSRVVLCERGIRTFEPATRNTLDLSSIPVLKRQTHLPVIVDPSHATGRRDCVTPLALAAVAGGADGIMIEVHPRPDTALCDGAQSLHMSELSDLMVALRGVAMAVGRELAGAAGARAVAQAMPGG